MNTKRINLSFALDREDDLKVFNVLTEQKYKTDFVIKAVINYLEAANIDNDKEFIKQAMREFFQENGSISIDSSFNTSKEPQKEAIPSEIFDMFNNL